MNKPLLEWSGDFVLDETTMDDTHREFVDLLNRVAASPADDLLASLDEFIVHTEAHFGAGRALDAGNRLSADRAAIRANTPTCSKSSAKCAGASPTVRRSLARRSPSAIAEWFPQHAGSMDAVLAMYMKQIGYVPGGGQHRDRRRGNRTRDKRAELRARRRRLRSRRGPRQPLETARTLRFRGIRLHFRRSRAQRSSVAGRVGGRIAKIRRMRRSILMQIFGQCAELIAPYAVGCWPNGTSGRQRPDVCRERNHVVLGKLLDRGLHKGAAGCLPARRV